MGLEKLLSWLRGGRPAEAETPPKPEAETPPKPMPEPEMTLKQAQKAAAREFALYNALPRRAGDGWNMDAAEKAFWKHCETLPAQVKALLAYKVARQAPPHGHAVSLGFYNMGYDGVFRCLGWAETEPCDGVAFSMDRACFAGRDPLLFYAYDCKVPETLPPEGAADEWYDKWLKEVYGSIEGYSSGVRLEGLRGRVFLFRLDETKIKKLDILRSLPHEKKQPDYVFTWPGAGEFDCALGEVVDGKLVTLYTDDFVMK